MSDPRSELEQLLRKHAKPGTSRIDVWDVGSTKRLVAMAEWLRDGEPIVERIVLQGCRTREQAYEELLAAVCLRMRGKT